jgi:hypothetical protein
VRQLLHIAILAGLILATALPGSAQEIRMANGVILKGTVKQATDAGLEIQTQAGPKTYTWETLSSATRFRYQPIYRENFEPILQGLPPSARTNKPVADAATTQAEAAKPEETAPKETPQQSQSLRIFDQAPYENIDSLSSSQIPNLQLRTPNSATYMGLQYGPTKKDVIYMIFDPKSAQDAPDTLLVYSPGNPAYSNAVRLGGFKKGSGDTRAMSFKKFKLNSRFGLVMTDYEIECAYSEGQTNSITMTISVDLYKGNTKNRFLLSGQTSDLIQGDGIINVKGLLDLPVLWVGLDLTTGSPRLVGNLNMSHLKLAPKEGMENRVSITIIDDKGEVTQRESIKLDESTFSQPYGITCELKRIEPGKTYIAKAAIDLGSYIGPAVFEEKLTIPGAAAK